VAGHNPKEALPEALREPGAASKWEEATVEALRRTVMFLREEASLPHEQALPYALPAILLPGFFHRFPEPGERTIELLVRWVWRGIAGQTHMATNQQFNPHIKALRDDAEEAVAVAWLRLVARSEPASLPESDLYNRRGMKTRVELAALLTLGPRSLVDSHELSPVEIFEAEPRREQPLRIADDAAGGTSDARSTRATVLPRLPPENAPHHRLVGARFLHPEVEGGDQTFARVLVGASTEVLRSHGIDHALHPALRQADWTAVAEGRTRLIHQLVERMITQHARWGEDDDGPSIEASLVGDDGLAVDA
jgi:hypothetical protein